MNAHATTSALVIFTATLAVGCGGASQSKAPTLPAIGGSAASDPASATDLAAGDGDAPWRDRTDLIELPPAPPAAAISLPPQYKTRLPNGLTIIIEPDAAAPVISAQLAVRGGWSADPADRAGLAAFAAQMLIRGHAGQTAAQVAKAIGDASGSLASDASYEATVLRCDALAEALDVCLAQLAGAVASPTFPREEMPAVGERLAGQVKAAMDSGAALAAMHAQNVLWGNGHPRGRAMSLESLRAISRDELVAWHKAVNRPERAILVITGNVGLAPAKTLRAAATRFGAWRATGKAIAPIREATPIASRMLRLVDLPGQGQAYIAIAIPGIAHQDSRFFDTLVWNQILGGAVGLSRLSAATRGTGTKAFGATSMFDRNNDRGAWVATTTSRTADAATTLAVVLREIKKMQADGPTEAEVGDALRSLIGSYGLRFESANALASGLLAAYLHDFDDAYVSQFPVVLAKSTRASVAGAANEILSTPSLAIAIAGDAARIAPQLDKLGLPYERVAAKDPLTPVKVVEAPDDPKLTAKARALLDAALVKKGGKAALAARTSLRLTATGAIKNRAQVIDVALTRVWGIPNNSRVDLVLNKGIHISYAMSPQGAWQDTPNGLVDVPPAEVATVERERWLDPDFILLRHTEPGATVRWVGEETVAGAALAKVNVTSADKRFTATLFIDPKTKLVSMVAFPEGAGVGTMGLEDYRNVGGVQVAHKRTTFGGDETVTLVISKFEWNVPAPESLFAKPSVSANAASGGKGASGSKDGKDGASKGTP